MAAAQAAAVISKGVRVKGTLRGAEALAVQGTLEGRVELRSHLVVQAGGRVDGDVVVDELSVHGALTGTVVARERVVLAPGAQVQADLRAPRVLIHGGAHFRGRIEMDVPLPADV